MDVGDIQQLWDWLPEILLYLACGYFSILTYSFISLRKKIEDINSVFVVSLIVGYALKNVLCLLPWRFNPPVNSLGLIAFGIVVGGLAGLMIESRLFLRLMSKIRINRTVNEYIWHDLYGSDKKTIWIRVTLIEEDRMFLGILKSVEEFQRFPQIVIQQYIIYDLEGNELADYTDRSECQLLIKTEDCKWIDIIYDKDSPHAQRVEIQNAGDE